MSASSTWPLGSDVTVRFVGTEPVMTDICGGVSDTRMQPGESGVAYVAWTGDLEVTLDERTPGGRVRKVFVPRWPERLAKWERI